jgi:hypothetical protein
MNDAANALKAAKIRVFTFRSLPHPESHPPCQYSVAVARVDFTLIAPFVTSHGLRPALGPAGAVETLRKYYDRAESGPVDGLGDTADCELRDCGFCSVPNQYA